LFWTKESCNHQQVEEQVGPGQRLAACCGIAVFAVAAAAAGAVGTFKGCLALIMLAIWQQMDILRVPSTAAGAAAGAAVAGTGSCHATLSDGGLPPNIAINAVTLRRGHSLPDSMSSSSTCSSYTQQSSGTPEHLAVGLSATLLLPKVEFIPSQQGGSCSGFCCASIKP